MELKILSILIPILVGLGMFVLRHIYKDIADIRNNDITEIRNNVVKLDNRLRLAVTEPEVRQILADKLLPIDIKSSYISDDVIEIKHSLDTILNKYLMKEKV